MHPFTFQFKQQLDDFELRVFDALEEALTQAYEEQGMTRSDAQGAVEAILMQVK